MDVLQDKRKRTLAQITLSWFTYCARRWVSPECFVISSAIIITGETKAAGSPEDYQRRRPWKPAWEPGRLCTEPAVGRITKQFRGVERRQVRTEPVVVTLERCPG